MQVEFCSVKFDEIKEAVIKRISSFPSLVDGFLIDHILDSNHYKILIDTFDSGYFSVFRGSLLTQFYLKPEFSRISQTVFQDVRRMEKVEKAFVPTCDEYFLSHAIDEHKEIIKQAYFFNTDGRCFEVPDNFNCELAEPTDLGFIKERTDDFFDEPEEYVKNKGLWIAYYDSVCVGFGITVKSPLLNNVVDLGMIVNTDQRQKGYGTMIIRWMINHCNTFGFKIAAGCGSKNHLSKKTLERAGMYSNTRLLKVIF